MIQCISQVHRQNSIIRYRLFLTRGEWFASVTFSGSLEVVVGKTARHVRTAKREKFMREVCVAVVLETW